MKDIYRWKGRWWLGNIVVWKFGRGNGGYGIERGARNGGLWGLRLEGGLGIGGGRGRSREGGGRSRGPEERSLMSRVWLWHPLLSTPHPSTISTPPIPSPHPPKTSSPWTSLSVWNALWKHSFLFLHSTTRIRNSCTACLSQKIWTVISWQQKELPEIQIAK